MPTTNDHDSRSSTTELDEDVQYCSDEETPLLTKTSVYDRFTRRKKRVIVGLVSWCGLMPLFTTGSFFPTIPDIARDLNSSGAVISLAVSLSVLATSIGALFAASYSSFYGRRPIYLLSLPLLVGGSIGVAFAQSIPALMVFRFLQAFGASPGLSVGAGVIGDIYPLESRGGAMGVFFAACLLGPALAPLCGGAIAQAVGWRVTQWVVAGAGAVGLGCMWLLFPETSHPSARGLDAYRKETDSNAKLVWVNPLRPLALLKSPNLLAVTIAGLFVLLPQYVVMTALPFVVAEKYGITNQSFIGLCYLPVGLGNLVGAPLAGRLSDIFVRRSLHKNKTQKDWYPEARLQGTLIGAGCVVPLSVLGSGLVSQFGGSSAPWLALNAACLFLNGLGADLVLSPSAAYGVDIMHSRSAESMAANNGLRSFLMAGLIAGVVPLVEHKGIAAATGLAAGFAWIGGFGLLWTTVMYGAKMRSSVKMEYSTQED
ncbi:MFS general substrate transporter [Cylindrobasidium torrendii FP15055 ss-10]|uniref:MFS general substrate transporter n=1 Tax=Cylindrobasidium torrendii FP15055 ss-10 TaxID=1314674 RepID=A0A0D7BVB7_9AGAR|nr:MFS general substrate transporter [Cylindrobasidium torrendii FP15055 ss-10]